MTRALAARSLRLPLLIAAVVALGLAAGLFLGGTPNRADPAVAEVNGVTLRLSDVRQKVQALPLGDQIDVRQSPDRFAESVIQEELLFQYGLSGELREQVKAAAVEFIIDTLVKSKVQISDQQLQQFYHDNRDQIRGEHIRVRSIQLAERRECEALQPQLVSEQAFIKAAERRSLNKDLAARGGDMGYLMRHFDVLGFEAELFGLPLRQTHLFENADGCYLIWISEYLDPPLPPLAEVEDNLRQILSRQREVELLQALLEQASEAIPVKRYALPE